jgi:hypothetical protein
MQGRYIHIETVRMGVFIMVVGVIVLRGSTVYTVVIPDSLNVFLGEKINE